ncbi:MAG: ABC transporter ATP-binding protein [Kiritimatiellae bacterium]|nr:ABC transporter ATP-binding protein [Kiritimatiellia bacterium]MDD5522864.1 ABC transporter ATP-binding protein [Kiritimatiellia bacterium]
MKTVLEFRNVSAGYHSVPVIRNLDLTVTEGQMVGILGPNGAGKTTFLRCITGLCSPMTGIVSIFGSDVTRLPAAERARLIAVVPQELEIPASFTVQEIVMIGRTASLNRWSQPSLCDVKIVERAMVYTDVADIKHRPVTELSGGEKQRVIVAMALAQEPRMILMDEATSHLDMNHRLEIMQIIERLNIEKGVSVIMVSHDLNLTAEFCQRIILMDRGKIAADGKPSEVLTENILSTIYNCNVRVQKNQANGSVCVLPAPRLTSAHSGRGITVHVVAGGGCGEEILRRLNLADYTITSGVLNKGDSDAEVAGVLGIPTVLEKPFSPVSRDILDKALVMAESADIIVVCAVPFGPGNAGNLELAEQALAKGKQVFLIDGISQRDYTYNREATTRAQKLLQNGARVFQNIPELLKALPTSA